jgi:hypothetical protein
VERVPYGLAVPVSTPAAFAPRAAAPAAAAMLRVARRIPLRCAALRCAGASVGVGRRAAAHRAVGAVAPSHPFPWDEPRLAAPCRRRGEPSPSADLAGESAVPAQMWQRRAQSWCGCGRMGPLVPAQCGRGSPFLVQVSDACRVLPTRREPADVVRIAKVRRTLSAARCLSHVVCRTLSAARCLRRTVRCPFVVCGAGCRALAAVPVAARRCAPAALPDGGSYEGKWIQGVTCNV